VRETVDRIVNDDVHLTRLGVYYMALVNYASVYKRSPVGAWVPGGVSATQAEALQNIAWRSVSSYYSSAATRTMDQCQAVMRDQVCSAYNSYRNTIERIGSCMSYFTSQSQGNPFYYNASTDAGYWFPAPR
jgi:hypothetical protein